MSWIVLLLTLLLCLAQLADFLWGKDSDKSTREKLYKMYLRIEGGDWRACYQAPAAAVSAYMNIYLISGGIFQTLIRVSFFSILLTCFMFLLAYLSIGNLKQLSKLATGPYQWPPVLRSRSRLPQILETPEPRITPRGLSPSQPARRCRLQPPHSTPN